MGLNLLRRRKLGTADGLVNLHGKRLPGLQRQRQLRQGHRRDVRRRVMDDLGVDQARREDPVVDNHPENMLSPTLMPKSPPMPMKIKFGSRLRVRFARPTPLDEQGEGKMSGKPPHAAAESADEHPGQGRDAQRPGLLHRLVAVRIHDLEGFAGGNVAGEAELIHLDHLPLQRNRHEQPQVQNDRDEQGELPPDKLIAGEHRQGGHRGDQPGRRNPACRHGHGHHHGVFHDAECPPHDADGAEGLEDGEDDDDRGDVHAQPPARLQADVEVRHRHQRRRRSCRPIPPGR